MSADSAWVHRQAAAADRAVVEVVDHVVQVEVERRVPVVERFEVVMQPNGAEWPFVLGQLVKQLDSGRLYDRDLQALAVALTEVSTPSNGGCRPDDVAGDPASKVNAQASLPQHSAAIGRV